MGNQPSEMILDPSLKEKRLAELNQKIADVYREMVNRLTALDQKIEACYQEIEQLLLDSGFSDEAVNDFIQRDRGTAPQSH